MSAYLIPLQATQRLSKARYATGTATEIRTQRDSNPRLTSTFHQVATKPTKATTTSVMNK